MTIFAYTIFALVDKNGNVRGQVYDGLKQDELDKLKDDIKTLLKEKANTNNFSNNVLVINVVYEK